jgi:NTP pyrophosphatase (non-canonical NTP hydrolase)
MTMNISEQIRKTLRDCGEPMTLAQIADAADFDADEKKQASKNLYNMKIAGEVVTHVAEERVHFALAAGYTPKRTPKADAPVEPPRNAAKAVPAAVKSTAATRNGNGHGHGVQVNGAATAAGAAVILPPAHDRDDRGSFSHMAAMFEEVARATRKFPTWPNDPLHALAVLGEEFGELTKACLRRIYEPEKSSADDVRAEALQTAAMALRFLISLDRYEFARGQQHSQA